MNSGWILVLLMIVGLAVVVEPNQIINGSLSCQSTSVNYCRKCSNDHVCKQCQALHKCCPKYCSYCTNMTICTTCQTGFKTYHSFLSGGVICVNNISAADPNRDKYDENKCFGGYYLHPIINFCEKCPTQYCKICSINTKQCSMCFQGYQLQNGICFFRPLLNISTDNNSINIQNKTNNLSLNTDSATQNTQSSQDQGALYTFFFVLGSVIGFCLACILMKLYFCIKKRCQNLYKRFKNRSKNKQAKSLIKTQKQQMQENEDTLNQTPKVNDQQKQFAGLNGFTRQQTRFQMDDISHITYNKNINRSVITEGKN